MSKNRTPNNAADDLVAEVLAGDLASRDELVSAHLPHVWRIVYLASGGGSDVEDIVQNTIMQVLDKLPSYRGPGKFNAWLNRIAVNNVRQHYRKASVRLRNLVGTNVEDAPSGNALFEESIDKNRLFERLAHHLRKISNEKRYAVLMSYFYGYSAGEIAEFSGCSEEAAWKRTRRGQKELLTKLDRDPLFEQLKKELIQ